MSNNTKCDKRNDRSNDGQWNCTSCTFLNEKNRNRCLMCHAHRVRSVTNARVRTRRVEIARSSTSSNSCKGSVRENGENVVQVVDNRNQQCLFDNSVVDLTTTSAVAPSKNTTLKRNSNTKNNSAMGNSNYDDNENIESSTTSTTPMIASTDSARKRRKKRRLIENNISNRITNFNTEIDNKKSSSTSPSDGSIARMDRRKAKNNSSEESKNKKKKKRDLFFGFKNETEEIGHNTNGTSSTSTRTCTSANANELWNIGKSNDSITTKSIKKRKSLDFPDYSSGNSHRDVQRKPSNKANSSRSSSNELSTISSSTTSTISSTQSNPTTTAKVQQTLFGSIVPKAKKSNANDSSKNENQIQKKKENSNKRQQISHQGQAYPEIEIISSSSPSSSSYSPTCPLFTPLTFNRQIRSNAQPSQPLLTYDQLYSKAIQNLQTIFKIKSLRNLQPKAIETVFHSESQIIIMATGGGKSLCYQLPATVLQGVTIVLSPLIALMVDQVNNLRSKGVEAVHISSMNGAKENTSILKRLLGDDNDTASTKKGKKKPTKTNVASEKQKQQKKIKLVYCTPESMQGVRFRSVLTKLYERNQLSLIALDEAHCLSTWGHEFRPAYRKLSWLRSSFPDIPFMACTATATNKVIEDIRNVLNMNHGEKCYMSTFNRPNVQYEIRYKDSMGESSALEDLVKVVQEEHSQAARKNAMCSGIVYVHKRDDTTLIASEIAKVGITAAPYHAGLKDKERKEIQQKWTDGHVKVAVATVAFGMGIDLAHVRYVIHWSMSKSVEGFYQESGRAGRDGLQSKSILYYSRDDASKFQFLIRKNAERRANSDKNVSTNIDDVSMEALEKMIQYCTEPCCRRKYILNHFGEEIDPKTVCKKTCDYCLDPHRMERAMNKSMATRAKRDIQRQQQNLRNAKVWQGREGDEYDDEEDEGFSYDDDGLGIYSSSNTESFPQKAGSSFKSARDILKHYEAKECAGQKNGFVTFKKSWKSNNEEYGNEDINSKSLKSSAVKIPQHLRQKMNAINQGTQVRSMMNTPKPAKTSQEFRSEADKLRAELAELKRKSAMFAPK